MGGEGTEPPTPPPTAPIDHRLLKNVQSVRSVGPNTEEKWAKGHRKSVRFEKRQIRTVCSKKEQIRKEKRPT